MIKILVKSGRENVDFWQVGPLKAPLAARSLLLYVLMRGASGTFW